MKLLFGIAEMGIGGAEAIVAELTIHRLERGDDVALASAGGFRADRLESRGARLVPVPMRTRTPNDLLQAMRILRRELRRNPPQLMHVHNVKAAAVLRAARGLRRTPTLVTLHGVPDSEYRSAARVLRRGAHRVVAVSVDVADKLAAAGYPRALVSVIENAIQVPDLHDGADARRRLDVAADVPLAVCIARLVDQKRHDLLVDAWQSTPANAVLLIAGDGPNRDRIARQIADCRLGDRVRLLGARTDVDWLLAAADVSVLPSDWEGLPISVLEAMAAGVPVVASAVGGLPATVGNAAELVAPNSAAALADALKRVLADAEHRDHLRAAARAVIAERFSVERMCEQYDAEYQRLVR